MKRVSVTFPPALHRRLRHEAELRATSMAQVVRDALASELTPEGGRRTLSFIGIGSSGRTDLSARLDEILAEDAEHWARQQGLSPS